MEGNGTNYILMISSHCKAKTPKVFSQWPERRQREREREKGGVSFKQYTLQRFTVYLLKVTSKRYQLENKMPTFYALF
jgi:hypothetical protein